MFLPDERIDLATALAAFTIGLGLREPPRHDTGSIEVGKLADLAVLDRDLFAHPVDEIAGARCLQTYVDGARVYAADDA